MANSKEAIAIVLDIGPSMCKLGDADSYLEQACHLVTLILQRKLFSESKDEVSLVLFGTEKSKNDLNRELGGYKHVSVDTPVSPVTFELIEQFKKFTKPDLSHSADFIDAMVVAMEELKQKTENLKAFIGRRIILLSCLNEPFSHDLIDDVVASLQEHQFGFTYLGPSSADAEGGEGAKVVARMVDALEGDQFTFEEVYPCLSSMQSRSIRPTAWKATLTIATSLQIPVCMYTKVKEFKPRSFSKVWAKDSSVQLQRSTTYKLEDSTIVDKADVIDGYRYGTTLIPFSTEDKRAMLLKTEKCFKVLGFTKLENVKRHQYFGDAVWICMAEKDNKAAQLLFSSLMHALYETCMVAVVRRVHAGKGQVHVGCLMPSIKADVEFMHYIQLPFFEDMRQSPFRPLPLEANHKSEHAFNEEQMAAMDNLIDCMNLSKHKKENGGGDGEKEKEEEEEEEELFRAHKVFNPYLQRLYQCIGHRALNPEDASLPPIPPDVHSIMQLPDRKVLASKPALDKVKEVFTILHQNNKVPAKSENVPWSDGKTSADETQSHLPVEEFKALLAQSVFSEQKATDAMMMILASLLQPSCLNLLTTCLSALRLHRLRGGKYSYNVVIRLLKTILQEKADAVVIWREISRKNLGLVTKSETPDSDVTEEEAKAFLSDD